MPVCCSRHQPTDARANPKPTPYTIATQGPCAGLRSRPTAALDRSCTPRPDGSVGTKGVPTYRPLASGQGRTKGCSGKTLVPLLPRHDAAARRGGLGHSLGGADVGGGLELDELLERELRGIGAVAHLGVRHPALDPSQGVERVLVARGVRRRRRLSRGRLGPNAASGETRRRRRRVPASRRSGG